MSAYFVTATGTGIGKTFVTAGLVRLLRATGKKVNALKPIVSDFDPGTAADSDPGKLLEAMDEPITDETLGRISSWRFAASLSPDMAAAREGRRIDYGSLLKLCRDAIAASDGTLFIEGVGGIMVPLDPTHTVLDWVRALDTPLILVAGSYLGTISHTLTALGIIAQAKLKVAALVINDSGDGAVPMADTIATLRRFAPPVAIVSIARVQTPLAAEADLKKLVALL